MRLLDIVLLLIVMLKAEACYATYILLFCRCPGHPAIPPLLRQVLICSTIP